MSDRRDRSEGPVPADAGEPDEAAVHRAADVVAGCDRLVAFTGAGVSTESGIPDFRSPGGLWDRYDPRDFTIQSLKRDPMAYWERRLEMRRAMDFDWETVEPNPAHEAIAQLEAQGPLTAVVTQNVDGLHQAAGCDRDAVLELHGTRTGATCLGCDRRFPSSVLESKLDARDLPPRCAACGGLLKRATVAFGEPLPSEVLRRAEAAARDCDGLIVVGSSLEVEPAASIPRIARRTGATLVVVNLESTPIDDAARAVVHGRAGAVLPRIVDRAL